MAGVTTASLGDFLVEKATPVIKSQLPNEVPMLKRFENMADEVEFSGREAQQRVTVNRNQGGYATAEGGKPPEAGSMQYEMFRIPMRYQHYPVQYTKQAEISSKSGVSMLKSEMKGMMDAMKRNKSFYLMGDGRGVRALINGSPGTGVTITLDSPGGFAGANHGNRFLNDGAYIAAINPATGLLRAGGTRQITGHNAAGTTVTINAACDSAWADNDYIVKAWGNDASLAIGNTDWQHPFMGIMGMVDNGTYVNLYGGLSRTTFPILQCTRFASVGTLSADIIQRALDVSRQVGGGKTDEMWMHPDTRRAYLTIMENDRRYMADSLMNPNAGTKAAGGYGTDDGLKFGKIPINTDGDFPYGTVIGWDTSECQHIPQIEGEWANETGSIWRAVSGAVDTWEATWRIYENYFYAQPNKAWRLDGVTTSFVVAHIS